MAILAISCAGDQGVQGSVGSAGLVGEQGPVGELGPVGEQGLVGNTGATGTTGSVGATGPSLITFTPTEMCCTTGDNVSVQSIHQGGYNNQVLVMAEQTTVVSNAKMSLGLTESWTESSEFLVTVFYSVSSVGGEIHLHPGIETYSSGDALGTEAFSGVTCITPGATDTIYSETWDLSGQLTAGDFMTLALERYTIVGGSVDCEDSSTADVYIHGVTLEFRP